MRESTDKVLKRLENHTTIEAPMSARLDPVTSIWDVHKMARGTMMEPSKMVRGEDDTSHMAVRKAPSHDGSPMQMDDDESILDGNDLSMVGVTEDEDNPWEDML